jgi:acetylornithine deacetylase
MWSTPPFEPVIRDGWMYGRGAGDMKAGVSAAVFALDALKSAGLRPAATIYLQSVVEEESTGNGALMTHLRGYRAEAALIPEPGREALTRANVGVLWFEIEVRGYPVHVAYMGSGVNAIDALFRVIGSLRELEKRWNDAAGDDPLFRDCDHPLNFNVGRIEGGDWASSVPAWCKAECRIAILPGTSAEAAAREIEETVTEFARSDRFLANNPPRLTWNGFFSEGYRLDPGSAAEAVLARAHEAAVGRPLETNLATAYLDARVYSLYDRIPALNYGCIAENYHSFDERVDLASLQRTTEVIALFIAEWCGVEPLASKGAS